MNDITDYRKLIEDKKGELVALHARMDSDRALVELASYVLKDVNNKKVPNSISVTLNDPAVFAANVESSLSNASEQVIVESDDKKVDTAYIEDFVRACFGEVNDRLTRQGRFPLNPYFDQQMCRRGRGAARVIFRIDKNSKQLIVDLLPMDTRYFYHGMGPDGLSWEGYETTRTKDMILSEYPKAEVKDDTAEVLDIWDSKHNEVWIGEEKIHEQPNPYDYVPVCLQLVPMGSMLADKDSIEHQGESIFFLIRDQIPELNRLASIIQSLNIKELDHALQWEGKEGAEATPPDYEELTTPGNITAADVGGGAKPVRFGELKREAYLLHSIIETRIQRGSLSSIDLGTLNFQLSAVALIEIGEGRDQVFLPRLGARGLLKKQLAEMMIAQVIQSGATSVEVGARGHKRTFDVSKLQGEYDIQFKYFIKSPKVDVARYSMASAAGDLVSDRTKRRDILQQEDPDGEELQLRYEEAERLSPAIKMNRTIRALMEMAKRGDEYADFEAELLSAEMGVNLKQMLSGSVQQQVGPEEAQKPKALLPLFGGGAGGVTSAAKAAELGATPRAEAEE